MWPSRQLSSAVLCLATVLGCGEEAPLPELPLEPNPVALGTRVPDLRFTDVRYLPRALSELGEHAAWVLVFTTAGCPVAERYLPRLAELEREYRARGVQFLAVNTGADTVLEMAAQAAEHGVDFPFVKDTAGDVAAAVGATRTPEVVVLDRERVLRYRGRVDAQYRLSGVRPQPGRADLVLALEDVLAGREVSVPETAVDGCRITVARVAPDPELTWSGDVARVFRERCVECHQPGGLGPFSLATVDDVVERADTVLEVVEEGRMPPWFASPEHGDFVNANRLTSAERRTVLAWLRAGAPRGADVPEEPLPPLTTWHIGEPDLVIEAPDVVVPAQGYVDYSYFVLDHVFAEDTWVEALEVQASEPTALHHAQVMYLDTTREYDGPEGWIPNARFLSIYVPGSEFVRLEPGTALLIPGGSAITVQLHYVTTGREVVNRARVGLRFPRTLVTKRLRRLMLKDFDFEIPPGAPAHAVTVAKRTRNPIRMQALSMLPHMHLRGKDLRVRATYPDGTDETLLLVANYSFDWQFDYRWEPHTRVFPAGTQFEVTGRYDNSSFNAYNPDSTVPVRFGEATEDEMLYLWLLYTDADEQLEVRVDPETGRELPGSKGPAPERWRKPRKDADDE